MKAQVFLVFFMFVVIWLRLDNELTKPSPLEDVHSAVRTAKRASEKAMNQKASRNLVLLTCLLIALVNLCIRGS